MKRAIYYALVTSIVLLGSVVGLASLGVRDASANGAPIKIVLTYLPDVSNWGPTNATGVAEVVKKEGQVTLSVVGLATLKEGSYTGWLMNTKSKEALKVVEFNTDQAQVAKAKAVLPAEIPDTGWNLFLVTVEGPGQGAQAPGERKSIGGYFPDSPESMRLPGQLPKTGGDDAQSTTQPSQSAPAPRQQANGNNTVTFAVIGIVVVGLGIAGGFKMRR